MIYQEPTLFPDLSVTENIFMGRQLARPRPPHRPGRDVRRGRGPLPAGSACDIDPRRPARGLSIADQQIIEIAKAISLDARLLIMDEPTAALSGVEVERLFAVARSLRDEGRALVFISHRFDEVFALCDTVTVMRDGAYVSTAPIADTPRRPIVAQMVGREVADLFPKTAAEIGEPVLEVEGLQLAGVFHDVRFTVRAGEIVGLAGLVGAGRSEIARAVFGVDGYDAGLGPAQRHARSAERQPARRDPRRDGLHPRGPAQAGPGDRRVGGPQRRRGDPRAASPRPVSSPPAPRTGRPAPGPPGSRSRPAPWT